MTLSFVGHALVPNFEKVKDIVKEQIKIALRSSGKLSCFLGGYGDFDELCARACRELRQEYAEIELIYVTPYFDMTGQAKIEEMLKNGLYDTSIYPPLESVPPRYAILKRNYWMMENSDLIIAYVHRGFGGAFKTLEFAKRRNKKVINIATENELF